MYLGIEIGGTKLQFGVGAGDGSPLVELVRLDAEPEGGAEGILRQIEKAARPLVDKHRPRGLGVGFGGPVDSQHGRTITSHQVAGWDDFPLADWCRDRLGLAAVVANDSDSAGLAEARFGAGGGHRVVFYNNVGSGIGGALVIEGNLYRGGSGVASEIGHLRPGLQSDRPERTLESIASGWAIAAAVRAKLSEPISHPLEAVRRGKPPAEPDDVRQRLIELEEADEADAGDLLDRCDGRVDRLDAKLIAEAARDGNRLARQAFARAAGALGWGIAQMVTLVAPDVVVLGGGVSLVGERLWLAPVRKSVRRYVFPPLRDKFEIVPAALGEEVVVHGALALAASC